MKKILVIGGAGYIGSYMCKYLSMNHYEPIVLDNLTRGHRQAVNWGPFFQGSMSDSELLRQIFSQYQIAAVMHFAAYAYVGESVIEPSMYYNNNVAETITLLQVMAEEKIPNIIFSSTCATYGEPAEIPITEEHPQNPINPYGRTKRMVEQILEDFSNAYGMNYASLRYFNAAGADPEGELGEDHRPETHLIPLVLQAALGQKAEIEVYGDDYPTEDGTCIRDYIHIDDLTQAHLLALERMLTNMPGGTYNLGNGRGYSVKELIDVAHLVTGESIPMKIVKRRPGDPAVLIGSGDKAMRELGWKPRLSGLSSIIETAWNWHKNHPNGYPDK